MQRFLSFFRSIRLAVVLIAAIIVFALLSTLVPQGRPDNEYREQFSSFVYSLITITDINNYTKSLVFWVPLLLFILNLSVCTIDRIAKRVKNKAPCHIGPDLIHVGLLILCVGGITTAAARREQDFTMVPGDRMQLSGGYTMSLSNFEFIKYPDGRPKAWISTVDLEKDGKLVKKDYKIEVNRPLAVGQLKVYQMNYGSKGGMNLVCAEGDHNITLELNQGLDMGDGTVVGMIGAKPNEGPTGGYIAAMEQWKGEAHMADFDVAQGDKVGEYTILSISPVVQFTGLRAASDPGFVLVLVALILASVGLVMTGIHKSKGAL